ncbi:Pyridoxamine 5'-phosphate oxidase family protein isoform 1 [Hibiscus syriacus]|uniref:Pyridoxamine 5'-phosphate oxidase family protein isoform 1 n=1 Tax=Hibiscus syriacus TaxID=106335 RepID=A0A6A2WNT7_HIBSY|nr:Pyridoxamine 5'-phosphate oxidase family protein isoform 1 [Hibiscus syriacus]
MGFLTHGVTGIGFILIGFWEFINSLNPTPNTYPFPFSSPSTQIKSTSISKTKETPFPSSSILVSIFSLLILLNSVVSIFDALGSKDRVGSVHQLQVSLSCTAFLALLRSGCFKQQESNMCGFYNAGIEIKQVDLFEICTRGNYTIKCEGHPEYHRARAIATLQFNCHLALLVILVVSMLSVISKRNGVAVGVEGDGLQYRPLGAEMQKMDNNVGSFTLDSDDLDGGIKEHDYLVKEKPATVELSVNDHGSHV